MSEWKEYKLNDLVTKLGDGLHGTPKYDPEGDYYFINGSNLIDGKISVNDNTKRVSKAEFDKYKKELSDRTIFVSINGTLGNIATYNNEKIILGKSACYFNVKDGVCKEFIKYIATDKSFQHYISEYATGSTIKNVPLKTIRDYTLKLPSLPTQTAIAEILSSLDDKIELNNKINKELENLAQTLFKRWFIDFEFPNENGEPYKSSGGEMVESELGEIPKGWEVGSIYDISLVVYGAPFKSSLFNQQGKGLPLIRIRDLKTFKPQNWTEEVHPKGTKIHAGDLVVGMDAEFRPHFWLGQLGWLNQRVCLFKPKEGFSRLFVRETIRPNLEFYENSSVGTTVIHLGKGDIDTFKTILPDIKTSRIFTEITEPLIDRIISNSQENETVRSLRDTLLPKLISGELEVTTQ
jgi:type I restriction enzyme S subunit